MNAQNSHRSIVAVLALVGAATASAQMVIGLGDLPGGQFRSYAAGVSNHGGVVVGDSASSAGSVEAFMWTVPSGMQSLGWFGRARAISSDGDVIVGDVESAGSQFEAVRWTQADGLQLLGRLSPSHTRSFCVATSADGGVAVGSSNGGSPLQSQGFRWTQSEGMVGLGFLSPAHTFATANGVSADGSTVVGMSRVSSSGIGEAYRWTESTGMIGLGWLPGDNSSGALGISADGTVIIGGSFTIGSVGAEPVIWTQSAGIQSLGLLPGYTTCDAISLSADGSIIVGTCLGSTNRPFIWTASGGMRRLDTALVNEFGISLNGWQLFQANAISPDGRAIVGFGFNPNGQPEAFLAMIPERCTGDLNADGVIELQDLATLLAHFGQVDGTHPEDGDLDGDADVDLQDLANLLSVFGTNC